MITCILKSFGVGDEISANGNIGNGLRCHLEEKAP